MRNEENEAYQIRPDDHVQGFRDAPVRLIEYADFQCPYSREAKAVVNELRKRFGSRLCYVFRHFPLVDVHESAEVAARAAEAASNQGMFWGMYEVLLENQEELSERDILGYASELGMDVDQFQDDIDSEEVDFRVREDVVEGEELGVDSTPTFFINGEHYEGPVDVDAMEERIQWMLDSGGRAA